MKFASVEERTGIGNKRRGKLWPLAVRLVTSLPRQYYVGIVLALSVAVAEWLRVYVAVLQLTQHQKRK
jgi:hypothetical protein